jgi:transposase
MQTITTIGLDIAKSVFQVHGVDAGGQVIVRRRRKLSLNGFVAYGRVEILGAFFQAQQEVASRRLTL